MNRLTKYRKYLHHREILLAGTYFLICLVIAQKRYLEIAADSPKYLRPTSLFSIDTPGILTSLVFRVLTESKWIVLFQQMFSCIAWLVLAKAIRLRIRGNIGLVFGVYVLLYSLASQIVSWQWFALSDGLTLTIFIAWIGFPLLMFVSKSFENQSALVCLLSIGLLLLLTRPQMVFFIMPVQFFFCFQNRKVMRKTLFFSSIFLLSSSVFWAGCRLFQVGNSQSYRGLYALNNLVSKPGFLDFAKREGGIVCPILLNSVIDFGQLSKVRSDLSTKCQSDSLWLSSTDAIWPKWVLKEPQAAFAEFKNFIIDVKLPNYSPQPSFLPGNWQELVLPVSIPVLDLVLLNLLIAGSLLIKICKDDLLKVNKNALSLISTVSFSALLFIFVTWVSDGMEPARHSLPLLAILPLVSLILPVALVDPKENLD